MAYTVVLEGGSPWGFRLSGGRDFNEPLRIGKLNPNSKAYNEGVQVGDYLDKINGTETSSIQHQDALQLIRNANNKIELELRRSDTAKKKKKTVIPEIRINGPSNGTDHLNNGNTSDSDYYYSSCDEAEGIVRTNALSYSHSSSGSAGSAGHQSDGDGSTSGSASSVVHVVSPYTGPLAEKMKNLSNGGAASAGVNEEKGTPHTTVWSPFGVNKVRTYKPVSFSSSGGIASPPPTANQKPAFNLPSSFESNPPSGTQRQTPQTNLQNISVSVSSMSTERKDTIGNNNNIDNASPSYGNFNGGSVIVTSASPGSSYTSITMNSRKELSRHQDDLTLNTNSISAAGTPTSPYSPTKSPSFPSIKSPTPGSPTKGGQWSPSQATTLIDAELRDRELERERKREEERQRERDAEIELRKSPSVWGPSGTIDSKQEYKALSVNLDRLRLGKPDGMKAESPLLSAEESFAWKPDRSSATVTTTTTTTATHLTPSTTMSYSGLNGSISHHQESKPRLPQFQSPTITLLQKSRENDIPPEAIKVGSKEIIDGTKKHHDTYYYLPGEREPTHTHRRVELKKTKYEGIGPTDEITGIPIVPRGSLDEKMHKDWYKRMYQSLHKTDRHDDINNYKPTYVFPDNESESDLDEGPGSTKSMDRSGYGKRAFTLPNAKYRNEKYKNQPMSIENYEPGFSSLAFRERKVNDLKPLEPPHENKSTSTISENHGDKKSYLYNPPIEKPGQFSKYIYSDSEPELKKSDRPLSPQSDVEKREVYNRIQKGGEIPYEGLRFPVPPQKDDEEEEVLVQNGVQSPANRPTTRHTRSKSLSAVSGPKSQSAMERLGIKSPQPEPTVSFTYRERSHAVPQNAPRQRHSVSGTGRSPTGTWDSRRRRDEEAAKRKEEMKRITAEERMKRIEKERKANEARRHNDFLSPSQKSPIPLNRYDEEPDVSNLIRPKKKMSGSYKGKAKAIYNFKAQNAKELSFRKNDVIYLLRHIDKNWYEGEHHGEIGIFPVNYVEVLMSLDEARTAAIHREGQAKAKYNFTSQNSNEVSFRKGDVMSLIRQIDSNWFEGRVDGKHGIFPVSYVDVLRDPDTPLPTPMSSYAPTPAAGSPSQLSPVSTISNGPAPTIPSAPISPRSSIDNFDFGQPFNFNQYASLPRAPREQSHADYGLDPLNMMRPASALGGLSDGYGTNPRDRFSSSNRPSSAVPFNDYLKTSTRDSGFYGAEESKSRLKREEDLMRSLSNPYEGRSPSRAQEGCSPNWPQEGRSPRRAQDSVSRGEEPRYPAFQALYNYRPQNPDELELHEGDVVFVMEKCDDDWYVGTSQRTKEFGTFPGNYVKPYMT